MNLTRLSIRQYLDYVSMAFVAFISTVASRELIASILPADTLIYYVLSMTVAYCIGIVINFSLQFHFTFHSDSLTWRQFSGFIVVALIGAGVTLLASLLLRYLFFDYFFAEISATLAFISGNVVASISTYALNAAYVFRRDNK